MSRVGVIEVLGIGGALALIIGGWMMVNQRQAFDSSWITTRWRSASIGTRMVYGHILWLPIAFISMRLAESPTGALLGWGLGLASYLGLGWSIPRQPLIAYQRRRRALVSLLPSLVNHLRIGIVTNEPRMHILKSYLQIPDRRLEPMQELIRDTIQLIEQQQRLPFEALAIAAQPYQLPALTSLTTLLAQSEREGTDPNAALERLGDAIERDLMALFREQVERRKLFLIGLTAVAVLSIVIQILYVAVAGSDLWMMFSN